MSRLWSLVLLAMLAAMLTACYEKSGGPDARAALREYLAEALVVEGELLDQLGDLIERYPGVYDESVSDEQAARDLIAYWTQGAPHVQTARREWALLAPPESAREFHEFVAGYLDRTRTLMIEGPAALRGQSRADVGRVLLQLAQGEKDADRVGEWFSQLFDDAE